LAFFEKRNGNVYGKQQWGIFHNGQKLDKAMSLGSRRPTGRKLLFSKKKQ
jgi:hypothetical protein